MAQVAEPVEDCYSIEESGCWIWRRAISDTGYGRKQFEGRTQPAHRVVWQILKGPIKPGYNLHHTCKEKLCVNPDHLEPIKHSEHPKLHTENRAAFYKWRRSRTHCKHGHEYTLENTYIRHQNGRIWRQCRECVLITSKRTRKRRKGICQAFSSTVPLQMTRKDQMTIVT